jgi:hypothetical protein
VDRLLELLGHHVQFVYTAWDRIVLTGYIDQLQRPENLVRYFRDVQGVSSVTPEALMSRTGPCRAWVTRFCRDQNIPLLPAPKGVRKEEVVAPYYRRLTEDEGVACVLSGLEQGHTFVSYVPRYLPSTQDPNWRLLRACRKRFLHYYFYIFDPVVGPMSLRVATFLPFTIACYLNGHSFLAQELSRQGVAFRKDDNAFLDVDDLAALEAASERLSPRLLEQLCTYWAGQLAPRFSPAERAGLNLNYRYSVTQIELATDILFIRSAQLKALFQRAAEIGVLLGGADRTSHVWPAHHAPLRGRLETVLDRRNEGYPITFLLSDLVREAVRKGQPAPTHRDLPERHSPRGDQSASGEPASAQGTPGRDKPALPGRTGRVAGQHRGRRPHCGPGSAHPHWASANPRDQAA